MTNIIACTMTRQYLSPVLGASLTADKLLKGGYQLYTWWHARKYAFVSKVISQARKAKSLNSEIKRLFNYEISNEEITLLDRMEKMETIQ